MAGLSGPIKSSYGDMNAAPGSRPEDYQKPAITGPVGGNFANKQGGLRAKAMNSAINPAPLVKPLFTVLIAVTAGQELLQSSLPTLTHVPAVTPAAEFPGVL